MTAGEAADAPRFVVVGDVNQGKSSIVAALSENEAVPIDSIPGTTTRSGEYAFRVDDRILFRIIDTPGFQQSRRALAWMRERATQPGERAAAVRAFVDAHDGGDTFRDEVELLKPILAGAGILYVVDSSSRFQPSDEAEMEILRWTGRPGMALINRTRERDHTDEWRPILEQFFNIVRVFDAHHARFDDRVELLRGFREIRHDWRGPIDVAVAAIEAEWADRRRRAARAIATYVIDALAHVERRRVLDGDDENRIREQLETAYRERLREMERIARDEIEDLYRHPDLAREDQALEVLRGDLFAAETFEVFGLTRGQLTKYGLMWGAAIGGAIDLMVGGLSLLAGVGIGALAGAATGWFGSQQVSRIWGSQSGLARALFPGETGRFLATGPVTNPRFAWVVLDRALVHYRELRDRSHARRDQLRLTESRDDAAVAGIVSTLDPALRGNIDQVMREVLSRAVKGRVESSTRERLAELLGQVLVAIPGVLVALSLGGIGG